MKPQRLGKFGDDRWSIVEDAMGPRYTALGIAVLLLAYGFVGFMDAA